MRSACWRALPEDAAQQVGPATCMEQKGDAVGATCHRGQTAAETKLTCWLSRSIWEGPRSMRRSSCADPGRNRRACRRAASDPAGRSARRRAVAKAQQRGFDHRLAGAQGRGDAVLVTRAGSGGAAVQRWCLQTGGVSRPRPPRWCRRHWQELWRRQAELCAQWGPYSPRCRCRSIARR